MKMGQCVQEFGKRGLVTKNVDASYPDGKVYRLLKSWSKQSISIFITITMNG